ncbi:MAG: class I SAM-dependent methyltransferase [Gammaproteobacteria bacterium]
MQISKKKVEEAYQKNARYYDLAVKVFYPLIGLRINAYRKRAVEYLNLKQGDCVVDLGCGTGLTFPLIMEKIGPDGKLIGVDISSAMLSAARDRVNSAQWKNVELIHSDIEGYDIPAGINGAISTGVFGYLNNREKVLKNIYSSLVNHGKVVIIDGKRPENWPSFLFMIFVKLSSPYGLTESYFDNNTPDLLSRLFSNTTFEDMYGGLLYMTSGEKHVCSGQLFSDTKVGCSAAIFIS